jgi:hypothetical protein
MFEERMPSANASRMSLTISKVKRREEKVREGKNFFYEGLTTIFYNIFFNSFFNSGRFFRTIA